MAPCIAKGEQRIETSRNENNIELPIKQVVSVLLGSILVGLNITYASTAVSISVDSGPDIVYIANKGF